MFSEEEFAHYVLPRDDVVYAYVVEDPETKELTDLISFYSLPSTIVSESRHNTLRVGSSLTADIHYNFSR